MQTDHTPRRKMTMSRRQMLRLGLAAGPITAFLASCTPVRVTTQKEPAAPLAAFEPLPLPYPPEALEPHIDTMTMEIHHQRHYGGYTSGLNGAIEGTDLMDLTIEEILGDLEAIPAEIRTAVRNNGGGYINHTLFWQILAPVGEGGEPSPELATAIDTTFGDLTTFEEQFSAAAGSVFGSGWAWLVVDGTGALAITMTPNQDTPISDGQTPILGLDVWEHAYYLNYQNRRADYVAAFWNIVNWNAVNDLYEMAVS